MLKKILTLMAAGSLLITGAFCHENVSEKKYKEPELLEEDKVQFNEVWAWVVEGHENSFSNDMAVTDLCYFSADVDSNGEISHFPDASKFENFSGRKHLVVTCSGKALTHMILDPKFGMRNKIISSIEKHCSGFDGVQIDFETILSDDREYFLEFIKLLGKKIPKNMMFTICVPARNKDVKNDIFDYRKITPLVDRVIVMAYDQHWSTSASGPVAGMEWCQNICKYAKSIVPDEKLVMGLPFYGRSWQDNNYGKAWLNSGVNRILNENKITEVKRKDNVPYAEFETKVKVKLWFDDSYSLVKRCQMYQEKNVDKVAFWRIGQEDPDFWQWISVTLAE